jgi:hypothetical protein
MASMRLGAPAMARLGAVLLLDGLALLGRAVGEDAVEERVERVPMMRSSGRRPS